MKLFINEIRTQNMHRHNNKPTHWRRLVKNIGLENQNIGGRGGKKWKMHGRFSIIEGARARTAPSKSTPMNKHAFTLARTHLSINSMMHGSR